MIKNKKRMIGALSGALALIIIFTITLTGGKTPGIDTTPTVSEKPTGNIVVEIPNKISSKPQTEEIKVDVEGNNPDQSKPTSSIGEKAKDPALAVNPSTPSQPNNGNGDGIKIGNEAPPTNNSETDAFIKNLEIQGCPYCGSHSCESFYTKDQWGNPCYTPSRCPKYDSTKDPVHTCQTCHKPCGDGTNGTCVEFVNDCYCPNCGKWVPARTCHTCE